MYFEQIMNWLCVDLSMGSQFNDDQYPMLFSTSVIDQELNTILILTYCRSHSERTQIISRPSQSHKMFLYCLVDSQSAFKCH